MTSEQQSDWAQRRRTDVHALLTLNTPNRPWHIALMATLGMAMPALTGLWVGDISNALLACVGSMVILYIPRTGIPHGHTGGVRLWYNRLLCPGALRRL